MTQNGKAPVEFDLDRYLRNSRKVDLSGIDWEAIPEHPSFGSTTSRWWLWGILRGG